MPLNSVNNPFLKFIAPAILGFKTIRSSDLNNLSLLSRDEKAILHNPPKYFADSPIDVAKLGLESIVETIKKHKGSEVDYHIDLHRFAKKFTLIPSFRSEYQEKLTNDFLDQVIYSDSNPKRAQLLKLEILSHAKNIGMDIKRFSPFLNEFAASDLELKYVNHKAFFDLSKPSFELIAGLKNQEIVEFKRELITYKIDNFDHKLAIHELTMLKNEFMKLGPGDEAVKNLDKLILERLERYPSELLIASGQLLKQAGFKDLYLRHALESFEVSKGDLTKNFLAYKELNWSTEREGDKLRLNDIFEKK
ncbi:MAG: hypothetical protein HRT47_05395 [Candidatus Caenarcaniphilales bacterium]|nr:hypothetical protein [Candidatus Caenarcaniphilales bacterium]